MNRIKIPAELIKINKIFTLNGFKAYLVGGAVRDTILGKQNHDWDLATDATPEQVMSIFHKVIPTGIAHGTVTIHIYGLEIETTTFRTEADYSDGRHPDKVTFATTIEEDLSRRDFTMNAIAAELTTGNIVDPFNGVIDIQNKLIRTVGNPKDRFDEDGLRPVRAIRFAGQLGFSIDEQTFVSLSDSEVLNKVKNISIERFRDEFCKMLVTEKPSVCLKLLEKTGIMNIFIPEFAKCRNCLQKDIRGFHEFDVADHLIYSTDGAHVYNKNDMDKFLLIRLCTFLHDIGKPDSKTIEIKHDEKTGQTFEIIHFKGHEKKGSEIVTNILTRLKFPNSIIETASHIVLEHMFYYESIWSNAAVRRFLIKAGKDNLSILYAVRIADIYGMHNTKVLPGSPVLKNLEELQNRINQIESENSALSLKELKVNGKDLIAEGIPSGKALGQILNELFETVIDSPEMNIKEKLIPLAINLYNKKYK